MGVGNTDGRYAVKPRPGRPLGQPLTDDEKQQVRDCLADNLSVSETARKVGIRSGQVTYLRKKEGLGAKRLHDNTAGTEAWVAIARQKRIQRAMVMQDIFDSRSVMVKDAVTGQAKYKTILKAPMGEERVKELDFIPAPDFRSEVQSINTLDLAITRIESTLDDQGQARAESMMEQILRTAGAMVTTLAAPRPGLIQE